MDRVTHVITSECEIHLIRLSKDDVKIRIVEKDQNLPSPTEFELEGTPEHIVEALASVILVLTNLEQILAEPS